MAEGKDERATETPNTIYDLSSVLFHALKGRASYYEYIENAEQEGDHELVDFFRRVRDEDSIRADEARLLLAERTPATKWTEDDATPATGEVAAAGASPGIEPSGVASEEITPPEPGDVPPRGTQEALPPSRMLGVEEVALPRTEEMPIAEEVSSGIPSQAPPGDVAPPAPGETPHEDIITPPRETSPEPPARTEETSRAEQDKGLVERAKDYLLGEGRESDYPRSENKER